MLLSNGTNYGSKCFSQFYFFSAVDSISGIERNRSNSQHQNCIYKKESVCRHFSFSINTQSVCVCVLFFSRFVVSFVSFYCADSGKKIFDDCQIFINGKLNEREAEKRRRRNEKETEKHCQSVITC